MAFEMINFYSPLVQKQVIDEVERCNEVTSDYGLTLTYEEATQLVETRNQALKNQGRCEFGGGVITKIIEQFCNSPYIATYNYAETMQELLDLFYLYKGETMDMLGDDALIAFMKESFDGICQGSLALLGGRELYNMAKRLRYLHTADDFDEEVIQEEGADGHGGY